MNQFHLSPLWHFSLHLLYLWLESYILLLLFCHILLTTLSILSWTFKFCPQNYFLLLQQLILPDKLIALCFSFSFFFLLPSFSTNLIFPIAYSSVVIKTCFFRVRQKLLDIIGGPTFATSDWCINIFCLDMFAKQTIQILTHLYIWIISVVFNRIHQIKHIILISEFPSMSEKIC